jgi:ABC-2 type transport system ATP-binding protein
MAAVSQNDEGVRFFSFDSMGWPSYSIPGVVTDEWLGLASMSWAPLQVTAAVPGRRAWRCCWRAWASSGCGASVGAQAERCRHPVTRALFAGRVDPAVENGANACAAARPPRPARATGRPRLIDFQNLGKRYGPFDAVRNLSLTVERGELFGCLGPNGAGKTTTIRMMMGILVPSHGRVLIQGLDCHAQRAEVQRHVGYLPDTPILYDYLRGREILQFVAEMHGFPRREAAARADRMLDEFGLREDAQEYAVNYSLGMKKKLGLACALIHEPEVLILDEPINGLDPRASRDVQERLRTLAASGCTIFVSTHLLDMAERLCSRIGIIHKGQLAAVGTPGEIKQQLASAGQDGSLEDAFLHITSREESQP